MNTCILFDGYKNKLGYGYTCHKGKGWLAHRWAYTQAHGPIPKGLHVRHMCHNPSCINPDHLAVGTPQDNADDKVKAGRQCRGETVNTAILTETQAREILAQKPQGRTPHGFVKALTNKYGVGRNTIHKIWSRHSWKHI